MENENKSKSIRTLSAFLLICISVQSAFILNLTDYGIAVFFIAVLVGGARIKRPAMAIALGMVSVLCALVGPAVVWEQGMYARTCPEYIVQMRGLLGMGSPATDAAAILNKVNSGHAEEATSMYFAAESKWGRRPELIEIQSIATKLKTNK